MEQKGSAQNENKEHEVRIEELEKHSLDWLYEKARTNGIPEWKKLSKSELVRRIAESSAPPH